MPKKSKTIFQYIASAADGRHGDIVWSDTVEAECYDAAKVASKNAYRQYVCDGYEPGSTEAWAALDMPVTIKVLLAH